MANAEVTCSYGYFELVEALKNGKALSFELEDFLAIYVPEQTCEVYGIEYDDLLDMWSVHLSCGHIVHPHYNYIPKFCEECGARVDGYDAVVVGHESQNMSDKENTCEGCAYEGLPGYCGCDGCARAATDHYQPKVVR